MMYQLIHLSGIPLNVCCWWKFESLYVDISWKINIAPIVVTESECIQFLLCVWDVAVDLYG